MANTERLNRMHFDTSEKNFEGIAFALRTLNQSIKTSKQHLTTLSMGNDPDESDYKTDPIVDPTRFLSSKEIHKWHQLSQSQKNRYIAEGIKASEKSSKSRSWLSNNENLGEEIERQTASLYTKHLHYVQELSAVNTYGSSGKKLQKRFGRNQDEHDNLQDENAKKNIDHKAMNTDENLKQSSAQVKFGTGSHGINESATINSTHITNTTASSMATTGGGAVVMAGKKAADKFKAYMQEKSMASEQVIRNAESNMRNIRNDNHEMDAMPGVIKYVGATITAVLLSVIAVIIQAIFSILTILVSMIIAFLIPIIAIVAIVSILISIIATITTTPDLTGGGERIVQIALQEENNTSGAKYWNYVVGSDFVNGNVTPWCASFVSWCAKEAGFIDSGIVPKAASVRAYHRFYEEKGRFHSVSGNYTPQPGDFIIFGSDEHIGIVQYVENGRVITIEGNTSDAVHSRSYAIESSYITGYCNPEYPEGTTIEIPEEMGTYHTYMGWQKITSPTSLQYQLRERSGEHYDSEGFAIIDGRYVIACTTLYGQVGDYIDFQRENGEIIHAVIGDIKSQSDPGCNQYGHDNGRCVVEFVVKKSTWYPSHANPGTAGCHPEWNSRVVRAVNTGYNYLQQ